MKSVLAIDQSTQGTKGILLNDRAEIVAKAYLPHRQIITPEGYISHDSNEIYKNVLGVAAKLLSECPSAEIAAVGISNQRETTAAWDGAANEPVTDAIRNVAIDGQGGDSPSGFKLDLSSDKRCFSCDEEGFGA